LDLLVFSSDWFLIGIGLTIEGSILLAKQKQFNKKYKFIEWLNEGNTEVIYVPTEANLPILEARDG